MGRHVPQFRQPHEQLAYRLVGEATPEILFNPENRLDPEGVPSPALPGESGTDGSPIGWIGKAGDQTALLQSVDQLGDVGPGAVEEFGQIAEEDGLLEPHEVVEQLELRQCDGGRPHPFLDEGVRFLGGEAQRIDYS